MADFNVELFEQTVKEKKKNASAGGSFNRDMFLGELMESLDRGQVTESVQKVDAVTQRSDEIAGAIGNSGTVVNEQQQQQPQRRVVETHTSRPQGGFTDIDVDVNGNVVQRSGAPVVGGNSREEQMYQDFNRASSELANRYNNNGLINEYNTGVGQPQRQAQPVPQNLNEHIEKTVVGILSESMTQIANNAFKNAIFETYRAEKIADGIKENKELIKKIVVETILQLQKRNQKKT